MRLENHPSLTSTNDRAMAIVRGWGRRIQTQAGTRATPKQAAAVEPVCVSADVQTAGRGRHGRAWVSSLGGAWFSIAWPWQGPLDRAAAAPLVVGDAVRHAVLRVCAPVAPVAAVGPQSLTIKWPNDLLLNGRKLAGVLCERHLLPAKDQPAAGLVVGVGINVNQTLCGTDPRFRSPAVSLADGTGGQRFDVSGLIQAAAGLIAERLTELQQQGLSEHRRAVIESALAYRGHAVTLLPLTAGGESIRGQLLGIDPGGGVVLMTDGQQRVLTTGEIASLRATPISSEHEFTQTRSPAP